MTVRCAAELPMSPLVSIVMCFHNSIDFVEHALSSLGSLAYDPVQLVLVDDASTDGTADHLKRLARDPRAVVICNERQLGVAASRTRALQQIKGQYVWFADPDDSWNPSIVAAMVDHAVRESADIVAAGAVHLSIDGHCKDSIERHACTLLLSKRDAMREVLALNIQGYLWNKLFRADLVSELTFPPLRSLSDLPFVVEAISLAQRILLVPERHYVYVHRAQSITFARGGPDLDDLRQAAALVRDLSASENIPQGERTFFSYAFELMPAVTVSASRGIDNAAVRRSFRLRHALDVWPLSRSLALKIIWVRLTGRAFRLTYRWARALKEASPRRPHARDSGILTAQ